MVAILALIEVFDNPQYKVQDQLFGQLGAGDCLDF